MATTASLIARCIIARIRVDTAVPGGRNRSAVSFQSRITEPSAAAGSWQWPRECAGAGDMAVAVAGAPDSHSSADAAVSQLWCVIGLLLLPHAKGGTWAGRSMRRLGSIASLSLHVSPSAERKGLGARS